jgi:uncharacterized protein
MLKFLLLIGVVGMAALPLILFLWRAREGRRVGSPPAWSIGLFVAGVFLYAGLISVAGFYIEVLWWRDDLKQAAAFWTLFWSRWNWGLLFAGVAALFMAANLLFVRSRTAADVGSGSGRIAARAVFVIALFIAFRYGLSLGFDHWREILLWRNGESFGLADPIFNRDVGFYLFSYPFLKLATQWFLGLVGLTLVAVVVLYLLRAAGRLGIRPGPNGRVSFYLREAHETGWNRLLTHASLLGALLFLGFIAQSRLAIWGVLHSTRSVVHGPGYTDVHVLIPALNAMSLALAAGFVLLLVAVGARSLSATVKALRAGVVLVVLVWVVGLQVVPGLVQRYKVAPNETTLEIPYIRHNMKFTRIGFGVTDETIDLRDFPAVQPIGERNLVDDAVTLSNVRLWDWRALESTYDQNQSFRQYYDFEDVDIDRYTVGGRTRQVMLALREMNPQTFSENARTWMNMRLVYTHGYGLCMNPTNEFNAEGLPNYWIRDIPPAVVDSSLIVARPEIYFGEMTREHVYVKSSQKEFDFPRGDQNVYTSYAGTGGIPLGSGVRRLALALRFDGLRQITSGDLRSDTRLLFRRDTGSRFREAAPFLSFDHDPYAILAGGRLYIMIDAYTTSTYFPYSERLSNGMNYIRNSVKGTIDCYDGTIRFYVYDERDPLIRAWRKVFPDLLRPASEMPEEIRRHVRYPEDFLSIQAHVYSTYHMTDPLVFYNKEDRWAIARETLGGGEPREMLPYYAVLKLPGETREEFVQLVPFTPYSVNQPRNNMVGWMAGRCDGRHYGKLLVYRFPKQSLIYGPMQIEARIDQDAVISKDLTLWNQQGSSVIRGNLIVLPLSNSVLYTEPIFLQATHSRMPELKRVVVASQDRLGYGASFDEALGNLVSMTNMVTLGEAVRLTDLPGRAGADTSRAGGRPDAPTPDDLARARELYRRYLELSGAGRLAEAGRELERLGEALGVRRDGQR